jgi:hypothetical protein
MYDNEPSIWINLQLLIEQPKIDWLIISEDQKRDEYLKVRSIYG